MVYYLYTDNNSNGVEWVASIYIMNERLEPVKYKTRLKDLREALHMERMDVVAQSYIIGRPVTYQTVMAWENKSLSRVDADTSFALRTILGCTLDDLIYEVEDED